MRITLLRSGAACGAQAPAPPRACVRRRPCHRTRPLRHPPSAHPGVPLTRYQGALAAYSIHLPMRGSHACQQPRAYTCSQLPPSSGSIVSVNSCLLTPPSDEDSSLRENRENEEPLEELLVLSLSWNELRSAVLELLLTVTDLVLVTNAPSLSTSSSVVSVVTTVPLPDTVTVIAASVASVPFSAVASAPVATSASAVALASGVPLHPVDTASGARAMPFTPEVAFVAGMFISAGMFVATAMHGDTASGPAAPPVALATAADGPSVCAGAGADSKPDGPAIASRVSGPGDGGGVC